LVEFTRRSDRLAPRLPLRINSFDPPLEKPPTGTANRLFQQTHSTSSPFPLQTEHVSPAVKQKQVWAKTGRLCALDTSEKELILRAVTELRLAVVLRPLLNSHGLCQLHTETPAQMA